MHAVLRPWTCGGGEFTDNRGFGHTFPSATGICTRPPNSTAERDC
jgi:hypothetical protein